MSETNKKLKILINAVPLQNPEFGGIPRYTKIIVEALRREPDIEIALAHCLFIKAKFKIFKIFTKPLNLFFTLAWEQIYLPVRLLLGQYDLYFSPSNTGVPCFTNKKVVSTIHDIIPFLLPSKESSGTNIINLQFIKWRMRVAILRSTKIITVSNYSKQTIVDYFKVSPDKIINAYSGADNFNDCHKDSRQVFQQLQKKFNLKPGYIMGIGGGHSRKNNKTLIEAAANIKDRQLVITGVPDSSIKDSNCIFTGYIDDDELKALYENAGVFVYLSIFEGFGVPPLEAMICGCPAIISNRTSLPEVSGDAAMSFDPYDVPAITQGIIKMLTDEECRSEYIRKGRIQAAKFTRAGTTDAIIKILRDCISCNN